MKRRVPFPLLDRLAGPVLPAAIALVHLVLGLLAYQQGPGTGGDDATYVALARSLIERHEYTDIADPSLRPHTQFPPVFPAIVALGLLADLSPDGGLRFVAILISAAAVFASCMWLLRVATPGVAVAAGIFIAISPEIVRLGQVVQSDAAFWCFSVLALLAWGQADSVRRSTGGAMPMRWVVAASAATILAHFTRSAGAPLLFAAFLWLAMLRERRAIAVLAGIAVPLVVAWWYRGSLAESGGYLAPFLSVDPYNPSLGTIDFGTLAGRFGDNISAYASRHIPRLVLGTPLAGALFGGAFAGAVLLSWARRLRRASLPEIWFPVYIALVLLWPVTWSGPRFLLPLVPLLALYACETVAMVVRRGTYPRVYATAAATAMAFSILPAVTIQLRQASACRGEYAQGDPYPCTDPVVRDFLVTAERARGRLPEGSVVLSRKPSLFFHLAGYRSRAYPMFAEPDSLFSLANRLGARYVVADRMTIWTPRYLAPVLAARRSSFCIMPDLSTATTRFFMIEPREQEAGARLPDAFRVCGSESRFVRL